jgi:isoamyl acetate esterase
LTIWFGANDACLPGKQQHVPLETYKDNLTKLIHLVRDPESEWHSPETRIILFTAPPVNPSQWLDWLRQTDPDAEYDRDFNLTKQYAEAAKEVGAKENVPVVDTWTLLFKTADNDEKNLPQLLSDGLHLNQKAYKVSLS